MIISDLKYWLGISRFSKLNFEQLTRLKKTWQTGENIWRLTQIELENTGVKPRVAEEFIFERPHINLNQELELLQKENINLVLADEAKYPELLRETYSPPFFLYYRGNLEFLNKNLLAIVGTRSFSIYGKQVTLELSEKILQRGLKIVSGLALGIDTLAHSTSVKMLIPTFGVLGSGLDDRSIYPRSNFNLAKEIIKQNGALLSEYPIGTTPFKNHFPARNRIIAGLSRGTLVIEAGEKSGALITAKFALDQNREVFAVPGPINHPNSFGTNSLIKRGAKAVTCVQDILEELNLETTEQYDKAEKNLPASEEELQLLKYLSKQPRHINELSSICQVDISALNSLLMTLEIKGKVKNIGNMNYILNI